MSYDPDMFVLVSYRQICRHHQCNPSTPLAGCTCSSGFVTRMLSPNEVARIKSERRDRDDKAELINAMRIIDRHGYRVTKRRKRKDAP
jgi:hypothetical protein